MAEEKKNYVTVDITRNMLQKTKEGDLKIIKNPETGIEFVGIIGPEKSSYLYSLEHLRVDGADPNKMSFSLEAGSVINLQYSERKAGVPDTAPNKEKYETITKAVTVEDLVEMYAKERRAFAQGNSEYVNMMIPTDWGKTTNKDGAAIMSKDGKELVQIGVQIPEGDKPIWYNFVIRKDFFKPSDKVEGMSYFGFPRKDKETGNEFVVNLSSGVKNEDGSYKSLQLSAAELKTYMDQAVERYKSFNNAHSLADELRMNESVKGMAATAGESENEGFKPIEESEEQIPYVPARGR